MCIEVAFHVHLDDTLHCRRANYNSCAKFGSYMHRCRRLIICFNNRVIRKRYVFFNLVYSGT